MAKINKQTPLAGSPSHTSDSQKVKAQKTNVSKNRNYDAQQASGFDAPKQKPRGFASPAKVTSAQKPGQARVGRQRLDGRLLARPLSPPAMRSDATTHTLLVPSQAEKSSGQEQSKKVLGSQGPLDGDNLVAAAIIAADAHVLAGRTKAALHVLSAARKMPEGVGDLRLHMTYARVALAHVRDLDQHETFGDIHVHGNDAQGLPQVVAERIECLSAAIAIMRQCLRVKKEPQKAQSLSLHFDKKELPGWAAFCQIFLRDRQQALLDAFRKVASASQLQDVVAHYDQEVALKRMAADDPRLTALKDFEKTPVYAEISLATRRVLGFDTGPNAKYNAWYNAAVEHLFAEAKDDAWLLEATMILDPQI